MLEIIDTNKLKKKFGILLSKLYTDNKFSAKEINDIIISRDYFDFLERQEAKKFLEESYEKITKREFDAEAVYEEETLSEFYWAGMMYITISLNKRIPLRTIMLLCPLDEMINHFKIYHEMNDIQFVDYFLNNNYQTSILKLLRKYRKMTVKELALITDIPEMTIKHYEKNNNNLFNASFENISKISEALEFSTSYFSRYSKFVPFTYILFEDRDIFKQLSDKIDAYYKEKGRYEFDGILLKRITDKKEEFVPEIVLSSAIKKLLIDHSKKDTLMY